MARCEWLMAHGEGLMANGPRSTHQPSAMTGFWYVSHDSVFLRGPVSGEQSSVGCAVKDWLLGTQAAPACEADAFARDRLMTADRSRKNVGRACEKPRRTWGPASAGLEKSA